MSQPFALLSTVLMKLLFIANAVWEQAPSTLIRADYGLAVGAYNDTIFLLGGGLSSSYTQMTEYRIDTDTFKDIGQNVLPNNVFGFGQFWSQNDEMIYIIYRSGTSLATFDMINKQFTADWKNIDVSVSFRGCLAASMDHIYVIGGYNEYLTTYMNTLQRMDLSIYEWTQNMPPMNERRMNHGCIVYSDYLWTFAGYNGDVLRSNERIKLTNILSNQWNDIEPLNVTAAGLRAIAWHQNIFIIGGNSGTKPLDTVHIVDVATGKVTLSPERLAYETAYAATVLKSNIIYVFGGSVGGSVFLKKWMYYKLASITSTKATTEAITSFVYNDIIESTKIEHGNDDKRQNDNVMVILMVVFGCVVAVILLVFAAFKCYKRYKKKEAEKHMIHYLEKGGVCSSDQKKKNVDENDTVASDINPVIKAEEDEQIAVDAEIVDGGFGAERARNEDEENKAFDIVIDEERNEGENNHALVRVWLSATVGLEQYFHLFIENGYDSLEFISKISDKSELDDIGITLHGHKTQIMTEIKALKKQENIAEEKGVETDSNDSDHKNDDLWDLEEKEGRKEDTNHRTPRTTYVQRITTKSGDT